MGHPTLCHGRGMNTNGAMKYKPKLRYKHDARRKQTLFLPSVAPSSSSSSSSAAAAKAIEDKNFHNYHAYHHHIRSAAPRSFFIRKDQQHHAAPEAPRNTTSYIIRSKCMHGLTPVVTPSPFTPPVLPTPGPSPLPRYKEEFAEEVNEWGVNGYGSMNGLIRVRANMNEDEGTGNEDSTIAAAQQQLELQRLDQGLSRFEMVYPSHEVAVSARPASIEVRLVDQEYHIAALEEENMSLRERLSSVEHELDGLRNRMQLLEGHGGTSDFCDQDQGEVLSEKTIGGNINNYSIQRPFVVDVPSTTSLFSPAPKERVLLLYGLTPTKQGAKLGSSIEEAQCVQKFFDVNSSHV